MIGGIIVGIITIIIFVGLWTDWFTCVHKWEYLGVWGLTFQQKRCKKCRKLKIVNQ